MIYLKLNTKKTIIAIVLMIITLSGCSTINSYMPWHTSDDINISVKFDQDANDGHSVTMLIVQPEKQDKFVIANYSSISQDALNEGCYRYVFLPKNGNEKVSLNVTATPLAIYFILKHQPVSGWKYYVEAPQGTKMNFTVKANTVEKE